MRFLSSIAVLAALGACTHTGRRPATLIDPFMRQCEKGLETFVRRHSLDSKDGRHLPLTNAALHLAEYDLANRARKAIAEKKVSCERNESISILENELSVKYDKFSNTYLGLEAFLESVKEMNASGAIRDPLFARKVACAARCDDSETCPKQCGTTAQFVAETDSSDSIYSLVRNCVDFEDQDPKKVEIFEQLFNNYRAELFRSMDIAVKETPKLMARMLRVQELMAGLLPKLQVARISTMARNCPNPAAPKWVTESRDSIVLLESDRSIGTGFYVQRSNGDLRLVTAQHVYTSDSPEFVFDPRIFRISKAAGKPPVNTSEEFNVRPGLSDRRNDIIQTPAGGDFKPLEVIAEFNVPMLRQRFHIAGFPGGARDNFQMYDCTFLGFERSWARDSDQFQYVLSCPGIPGDIRGMSGGPLADDFGRVWGVISEYSEMISRVYVSPMSRDKRGGINMGIQKIFTTDNCLRENMLGLKRCQVTPYGFSLIP